MVSCLKRGTWSLHWSHLFICIKQCLLPCYCLVSQWAALTLSKEFYLLPDQKMALCSHVWRTTALFFFLSKLSRDIKCTWGHKSARNKTFPLFPPPDALIKYCLHELPTLKAEGLSKEKTAEASPQTWSL